MSFRSLVVATSILFLSATPISAHLVGQPPSFRINGTYTDYYSVPPITSVLTLPQDQAVMTYMAGETLEFVLEPEKLLIPPDVLKTVSFQWDFGDGGTSSEASPTHTFPPATESVYVVLRVKDPNGFLSDSYVSLIQKSPAVSLKGTPAPILPLVILGFIGILGSMGGYRLATNEEKTYVTLLSS